MEEWKARTAGAFEAWETDQTAFDDMIRGRGRGHRRNMTNPQRQEYLRHKKEFCGLPLSTPEAQTFGSISDLNGKHVNGSRRIFDVCIPEVAPKVRGLLPLRFGLLPLPLIANGHSFFIQQLQLRNGVWPMAVHATYQFGDMPDYPFGKRQRFRDWGMWLVDDDEELVTSGNYLVLEDDEPLAPREPWVGERDYHVRGRQHVKHLERLRQRLAHGFALARVLNRTVVLPTFWCYCDKFWHRLDQCAIPSAASAQPLPFVCPMDHVLDPSFMHGQMSRRMARSRRGMLAPRVDGPWADGLPFRGHYWLRQLGAHPRIGLSVATLGTKSPARHPGKAPTYPTLPELLAATRTVPTDRSDAAHLARTSLQHSFVPGDSGPHITLPPGRTDEQLRAALQMYDQVRLLRVTLTEADELLSCYAKRSEADDMANLARLIFPHEWCYRPFEMTAEWSAVERRGKPRHLDEPWCVWGFANPQVPPTCPAA
jgi:hypothetical protein